MAPRAFGTKGGRVDDEQGIELAAAIGHIRSELEKAQAAAVDSVVAFKAESIELDFDVMFEATAGADAGVRVWVLSVGAKGDVTRGLTQHVKIILSPFDRNHPDDPLVCATPAG
jgi:hypothetical protein